MSIKKYTPGMAIQVGQWVTLDSYLRGGIAGRPAQVLAKTEKTVRVSELEPRFCVDEMGHPRSRRLTSVTFVCDTKDEAIRVRAAAMDDMDLQWKIERERNKEDAARRAAVVAKLLEGGEA